MNILYGVLHGNVLYRKKNITSQEQLNVAIRKGYKEVIYPEKTIHQSYGTPYIDGDTILFDVVDMDTDGVYSVDHAIWEQQLSAYQRDLTDSTEWLIKTLLTKGTLVVADIPTVLKELYQAKVAHRASEPILE